MMATERMSELLKTFARTLVTDYPLDEMLDKVCNEIVEVLAVTGAGVMLEDDDGHLRFVAASDDTVRAIEALQIELGEGPCLAAYGTGEVVTIGDLGADSRFRRFSPRARGRGMVAVQSLPLKSGKECVGALNLYSTTPGAIDPADTEVGLLLTDVCTTYIVNAQTLAASSKLAAQLQRALDSRVLIEQAKGMLAEQLQVSIDDAFEILRRYARSNGRKLHDVAGEVLDGSLKLAATP